LKKWPAVGGKHLLNRILKVERYELSDVNRSERVQKGKIKCGKVIQIQVVE
jgi:hypothetical protein